MLGAFELAGISLTTIVSLTTPPRQAAAEAVRDKALQEAAVLRARVEFLEAENDGLRAGWEKEKQGRQSEKEAAAAAAAEAAATIADLHKKLEEYSRQNNLLNAQARDLTQKLEAQTTARKNAEQDAAEWKFKFQEECERSKLEAGQLRAEIHLLNARIALLEKDTIQKLAAKDAEITDVRKQVGVALCKLLAVLAAPCRPPQLSPWLRV